MRNIVVYLILLTTFNISAQTIEQDIQLYLTHLDNKEFERALKYENLVLSIALNEEVDYMVSLTILRDLSYANFYVGRYEKTILYLESILPVAQNNQPISSNVLTDILFYLGASYKSIQNYPTAINYYVTLEEHLQKMNSTESNLFFTTLSELAFCHQMNNDFKSSKSYYEKALKEKSIISDEDEIVSLYDLYGRLLINNGDYSQGKSYVLKALNHYYIDISVDLEHLKILHQYYVKACIALGSISEYRDWLKSLNKKTNSNSAQNTYNLFFDFLDDLHSISIEFKDAEFILFALNEKIDFISYSMKTISNKEFRKYLISSYPRLCFSAALHNIETDQKISCLEKGIYWIDKYELYFDSIHFELYESLAQIHLDRSDNKSIKKTLKNISLIHQKYFANNRVFTVRKNIIEFKCNKILFGITDLHNAKKIITEITSHNDLTKDVMIFWGGHNIIEELKNYYWVSEESDSLLFFSILAIDYLQSFSHSVKEYLNDGEIASLVLKAYTSALLHSSIYYEMNKELIDELLEKQENLINTFSLYTKEIELDLFLQTLNFYRVTNNWSEALIYIDRLWSKINEEDWYTMDNLVRLYYLPKAQILFNLNQPHAAAQILEDCLYKYAELPSDTYEIILSNLSDYYARTMRFQESLEIKSTLLSMYKDVNLEKDVESRNRYIALLGSLMNMYFEQDSISKALDLGETRTKLVEKYYGKNTKSYASAVNDYGTILSITDNYSDAEQYLLEALKVYRDLFGITSVDYSISLTNLFTLYDRMQEFSKADSLFYITYDNFKELYIYQSKSLSDKEFIFHSMQLFKYFNLFLNYSLKRRFERPEFFEQMINEYFKISNLTKNRNFNALKLSENTSILNEYKIARVNYSNYLQASEISLIENDINLEEIKNHLNELERILFQTFAYDYENAGSIKQISENLQDNEQFIFSFTFFSNTEKQFCTSKNEFIKKKGEKLYLFCSINNNSDNYFSYRLVNDADVKIYEDIIHSEYLSLTRSPAKNTNNSKNSIKYFSQFFIPLLEIIDSSKNHIHFMPSDIMNNLTLDFINNPKTGRPIVEDYTISYSTQDAILNRAYEKPYTNQEAILFGNPDYNFPELEMTNESGNIGSKIRLTNLKGTQKEIDSLSALLSSNGFTVTSFSNKEATEKNIKTIVSPRILHIASHSFFIDPTNIDFTSDNILNGIYQYRYSWNQGLYNGIYLAGVNGFNIENVNLDGDNGILYSDEIENLNLSSTELVVLSSCESGIGTYGFFEGTNGLVEAIRRSGAKNLICTLWKVDDAVTQEFMTIFYFNYLNNMSIPDALSMAKNQIKKKYPEPYYWAGFVHYQF